MLFPFLIFLLATAVVGTFLYAGFSAAPWVRTDTRDIRRAMNLLKLTPKDVFYDIGSGDGSILIEAAKSGAKCIGFEIALLPYCISLVRRVFSPHRKNISIQYRNFWNQNFREATAMYIWLTPPPMPKLKKKIDEECLPGTRIVARVWPMENWKTETTDKAEKRTTLYYYII